MAKKRVGKSIDLSRVSEIKIFIKVLVQRIIISVISVYVQQCGLEDSQKDDFYDDLFNVEKEIVVILGDLSGHTGYNPEDHEDQHGGYDYGVRNKKNERIREFCAAMNMTVGNTLFKKRANQSLMRLFHQKPKELSERYKSLT